MGLTNSKHNPNTIAAVGLLCLALGLVIRLFVHPAARAAVNLSHALSGCFVGFAVVMIIWSFSLRTSLRNSASN